MITLWVVINKEVTRTMQTQNATEQEEEEYRRLTEATDEERLFYIEEESDIENEENYAENE